MRDYSDHRCGDDVMNPTHIGGVVSIRQAKGTNCNLYARTAIPFAQKVDSVRMNSLSQDCSMTG